MRTEKRFKPRFDQLTFMAAAFVIYLLLTGISDLLLRAVERHYNRGVVRA
ncbi:hypothetical protein K3759_16575 (plasmid) [Sulfitobacter sp. W027]|nr:hypothetical protein [Sulfitobacter sp. W027]UWR35273.1 hypothetical protein K3759_16575 [Sulfitobacter sp. W027]